MAERAALALGSGGARGYAHIGVMQVLAERGYEVVTIAGTSMGALVGGVAAAGRLEEYTEWALSLTQPKVLRLLDPTISGGGALRAERVIDRVATILGGIRIEDCPIPFTAVATDLTHQREVWFQRGPLHTAIRASIAIPTVITPVVIDGRLLVDGGLMNPVPIEPTAATLSDVTIAVSLSGPRRIPGVGTDAADAAATRGWAAAWGDSLRLIGGRLAELRGQVAPDQLDPAPLDPAPLDAAPPEPAPPDPAESAPAGTPRSRPTGPSTMALGDIVGASLDTMGAVITRYRMAGNPPDVLVTIPADACRTMDFHRAAEMISLGRERTTQALDAAGR